ncbi:MAG: HlyC/CorC family transporter [Bacteroidetes bacterium]|nr:HlyC/CorC family transporter [Bacteroidota bacterium]MBS1757700.1 HlyC/CorC family transporter [Bacteroidota bacterium]
MDFTALFAIIISLLFIGFFSGIEIAFISSNKLSIELSKKQGTYSGRIWGNFNEHPARFIGTTLIAFNIVLVIYGLLIGQILSPIWQQIEARLPISAADYVKFIKLFVETILSTIIILMVEFVCKAVFRARNNNILSNGIVTYIVQLFYSLLSGVAAVFVNIGEWILKYIFNVKLNDKKEVFSKVDLEHFIQQNKAHNQEETSEINKELFENALSLSEIKIRECLVPRTEIISIEQSQPMEEVRKIFISTRLSKLVVYQESIDNITGYIHQLDLFKNPASIKDILLPIPTVPESMTATDLMNKFTKQRKTIAWVIDEFGGTAGIVTMEDLLEEIFGDIKDEYDDVDEFIDKQLSENEYIFSGRLELDFITEKYHLVFKDRDTAETLSGFIIQHYESIPKQKERIFIGNYEFDILSVSDTRIETIKLKILK